MRFWDTSGLILLVVEQPLSPVARRLHAEDPRIVLWWGTEVEGRSALARLVREGRLEAAERREAEARLTELLESALEVAPTEAVRRLAVRLVRTHPLRAGDAWQLAAALVAGAAEMVAMDLRLRTAAELEGLRVLPEEVAHDDSHRP